MKKERTMEKKERKRKEGKKIGRKKEKDRKEMYLRLPN